MTVRATRSDGSRVEFRAIARVDTAKEVDYYRHGGILEYVLRSLLHRTPQPEDREGVAGACRDRRRQRHARRDKGDSW